MTDRLMECRNVRQVLFTFFIIKVGRANVKDYPKSRQSFNVTTVYLILSYSNNSYTAFYMYLYLFVFWFDFLSKCRWNWWTRTRLYLDKVQFATKVLYDIYWLYTYRHFCFLPEKVYVLLFYANLRLCLTYFNFIVRVYRRLNLRNVKWS